MSAASVIGINPDGKPVTLYFPNGASDTLRSHSQVELVIENYQLTRTVLFSEASAFIPIIGRQELVSAFDFGFDTLNWYWG
ncbi:MAG TPA: hypothetical protein VFJ58_27420 [Armatimonadota bacterium]|nr:hypothetical protein [Armatimonadota bacterium]